MPSNLYDGSPQDRCESARVMFAITPHDSNDLAYTTRGIYVGATGNITLTPANGGADVVFVAVPVGTILPVQANKVKATGTTATSLVGLA